MAGVDPSRPDRLYDITRRWAWRAAPEWHTSSELTALWLWSAPVVDQFTKEGLCTHADRGQTGRKVVEQLDLLVVERGAPESITVDNGGEFTGRDMENWAYANAVKLDFIRPGKPVQNGFQNRPPLTGSWPCLNALG